jgi:NAD(P)-dependent dehydrogenase (short-subunit alcohol dehydrogenase family)
VRRTVLVTGANRGIGREVARQLVAAGDRVVVTARRTEAAEQTAVELGGGALPATLDVTDPETSRPGWSSSSSVSSTCW